MIAVNWLPPPPDRATLCRPITCTRALGEVPLANRPLHAWMRERVAAAVAGLTPDMTVFHAEHALHVYADSWLTSAILGKLLAIPASASVIDDAGHRLAWVGDGDGTDPSPRKEEALPADTDSFIIRYPWDLLKINELLIDALTETRMEGECSPDCRIDGIAVIGRGTRILPGVYIEGTVLIGNDCIIGPNCYLRGNTSIGDGCRIGQAVEIKNSLVMKDVSIAHLSYCGDSIIGERSNLGAGTITSNFRHDGKPHRIPVEGLFLCTGRRKMGTIMGDGVHTGIHTSIYPGRMIWPGTWTRPAAVVERHIMDQSALV